MHAHDNPTDDSDTGIIPSPQKSSSNGLDKPSEIRPNTCSHQHVWSYDQHKKPAGSRKYSGHIRYVHGNGAERLRGELAEVTAQLLVWAAHQQSSNHSTHDRKTA